MVANSITHMSKVVSSVSKDVVKEYKIAILVKKIDISKLVVQS